MKVYYIFLSSIIRWFFVIQTRCVFCKIESENVNMDECRSSRRADSLRRVPRSVIYVVPCSTGLLLASCWFRAWLIHRLWRWRRYVPPKHWFNFFNTIQGVISQKIEFFLSTTVRISNHAFSLKFEGNSTICFNFLKAVGYYMYQLLLP
jgi:hypothetical protein